MELCEVKLENFCIIHGEDVAHSVGSHRLWSDGPTV